MIVFLIDADNLCAPAWVDEACQKLELAEGSISTRRAYGSSEKLKGLVDVLRDRSIRPFVNLSLSKNTTDVALAVDAVELSYQTPKPTLIAIGSGDADFVPLAVRLRERGIRVVCVSEFRKMAPEAVSAYDHVILVGEQHPQPKSRKVQDAVAIPSISRLASSGELSKSSSKAKTSAPKKVVSKKTTTVAKDEAALTKEVLLILKTVPALKGGKPVAIGEVAKLLHDAKLIGKNSPSTKLFKKYPTYFELTPAKLPNQVRFLRRVL